MKVNIKFRKLVEDFLEKYGKDFTVDDFEEFVKENLGEYLMAGEMDKLFGCFLLGVEHDE